MDVRLSEFIKDAGGVLVSRRILDEKSPLKWASREAPVNPADDGWRFLSADDTSASLEDPNSLAVADFNTVAAIEPAIISIYLLPVGTSLQLVQREDGPLVFYDDETGLPLDLE